MSCVTKEGFIYILGKSGVEQWQRLLNCLKTFVFLNSTVTEDLVFRQVYTAEKTPLPSLPDPLGQVTWLRFGHLDVNSRVSHSSKGS